ncbi:hypothetical protein PGQ11_010226 [Apiospora arundinis]|uniref:Uncharacterized protein n=1 Tax=Apiospora arundinis TaxID=335852 RepID=A0ABR2I9K8_9PEZI
MTLKTGSYRNFTTEETQYLYWKVRPGTSSDSSNQLSPTISGLGDPCSDDTPKGSSSDAIEIVV